MEVPFVIFLVFALLIVLCIGCGPYVTTGPAPTNMPASDEPPTITPPVGEYSAQVDSWLKGQMDEGVRKTTETPPDDLPRGFLTREEFMDSLASTREPMWVILQRQRQEAIDKAVKEALEKAAEMNKQTAKCYVDIDMHARVLRERDKIEGAFKTLNESYNGRMVQIRDLERKNAEEALAHGKEVKALKANLAATNKCYYDAQHQCAEERKIREETEKDVKRMREDEKRLNDVIDVLKRMLRNRGMTEQDIRLAVQGCLDIPALANDPWILQWLKATIPAGQVTYGVGIDFAKSAAEWNEEHKKRERAFNEHTIAPNTPSNEWLSKHGSGPLATCRDCGRVLPNEHFKGGVCLDCRH